MARGDVQGYIIGLFDELLGPSLREVRFPWAIGDMSPRTGRSAMLPFDAVWPERLLIVEVNEAQHNESAPFFDKPGKLTVSGVDRGMQRPIYDARKREAARREGYTVLDVSPAQLARRPGKRVRLLFDRHADMATIRAILYEAGILD